jgi:hypothetical protein
LTGPLILIAIGLYFLARNTWPELHLMEWLRDYWPVLLILLGAAKLVERLGPWHGNAAGPGAGTGGYWR